MFKFALLRVLLLASLAVSAPSERSVSILPRENPSTDFWAGMLRRSWVPTQKIDVVHVTFNIPPLYIMTRSSQNVVTFAAVLGSPGMYSSDDPPPNVLLAGLRIIISVSGKLDFKPVWGTNAHELNTMRILDGDRINPGDVIDIRIERETQFGSLVSVVNSGPGSRWSAFQTFNPGELVEITDRTAGGVMVLGSLRYPNTPSSGIIWTLPNFGEMVFSEFWVQYDGNPSRTIPEEPEHFDMKRLRLAYDVIARPGPRGSTFVEYTIRSN